jgi:hypothetical protein
MCLTTVFLFRAIWAILRKTKPSRSSPPRKKAYVLELENEKKISMHTWDDILFLCHFVFIYLLNNLFYFFKSLIEESEVATPKTPIAPNNMNLEEPGAISETKKPKKMGYFVSKKRAVIAGVASAIILIVIIAITRYASKSRTIEPCANNKFSNKTLEYECSNLFCRNPTAKINSIATIKY